MTICPDCLRLRRETGLHLCLKEGVSRRLESAREVIAARLAALPTAKSSEEPAP